MANDRSSIRGRLANIVTGSSEGFEDLLEAKQEGRAEALQIFNAKMKKESNKREELKFKLQLQKDGFAIGADGSIIKLPDIPAREVSEKDLKFNPFSGLPIEEDPLPGKIVDGKFQSNLNIPAGVIQSKDKEILKTIQQEVAKQNVSQAFRADNLKASGLKQLQENIGGKFDSSTGKFVQPDDSQIRQSIFKMNQSNLYDELVPVVNEALILNNQDEEKTLEVLNQKYKNDPFRLKTIKRILIDTLNNLDANMDVDSKDDDSWNFLGFTFKI
jgi:hypothetical protein